MLSQLLCHTSRLLISACKQTYYYVSACRILCSCMVQQQLHVVMHYYACTLTVTRIKLSCATLCGSMSHIHVQHCHAWSACVTIPCLVQLRGTNITLVANFGPVNSFCSIELHVRMRSLGSTQANFKYKIACALKDVVKCEE